MKSTHGSHALRFPFSRLIDSPYGGRISGAYPIRFVFELACVSLHLLFALCAVLVDTMDAEITLSIRRIDGRMLAASLCTRLRVRLLFNETPPPNFSGVLCNRMLHW